MNLLTVPHDASPLPSPHAPNLSLLLPAPPGFSTGRWRCLWTWPLCLPSVPQIQFLFLLVGFLSVLSALLAEHLVSLTCWSRLGQPNCACRDVFPVHQPLPFHPPLHVFPAYFCILPQRFPVSSIQPILAGLHLTLIGPPMGARLSCISGLTQICTLVIEQSVRSQERGGSWLWCD